MRHRTMDLRIPCAWIVSAKTSERVGYRHRRHLSPSTGEWTPSPTMPNELLIYPGWPDRSLADLIGTLEAHGEEALFCSLVDMYSANRFGSIAYKVGEPLIEACPYFDPDGYLPRSSQGDGAQGSDTPGEHCRRHAPAPVLREASGEPPASAIHAALFLDPSPAAPSPAARDGGRLAGLALDAAFPAAVAAVDEQGSTAAMAGRRHHQFRLPFGPAPDEGRGGMGALLHFKISAGF